jgi:uncharacterized protein (TIGR03382 family)
VEEAYCVPPYLAPCEEDRDCGSGFTCDQPEICEVSVSVAGGTETETEPVCESFGEKECRLVEAACTTDDDCIDGFACHSEAQPTPLIICMGEGCEDRSMPETRSYCAPEEWSAWGGHSRGGLDGGNAIRTDGEVLERKRVEQTAFFPVQGREKDDIGGCSVAGSGPGGHLAALLMLIGFARLGRRRRG